MEGGVGMREVGMHKRRTHKRLKQSLRGMLAEKRVTQPGRRGACVGSYHGTTGDGHAAVFDPSRRGSPVYWLRQVRGGQWAGPWERHHD